MLVLVSQEPPGQGRPDSLEDLVPAPHSMSAKRRSPDRVSTTQDSCP